MHQLEAGPDTLEQARTLLTSSADSQCGPAGHCHAQAGGEMQEMTLLRIAAVQMVFGAIQSSWSAAAPGTKRAKPCV